jgi:hypothetical protein
MSELVRRFEDEANQAHCELTLLRGECIRLRELNAILSDFIEAVHPADVPERIYPIGQWTPCFLRRSRRWWWTRAARVCDGAIRLLKGCRNRTCGCAGPSALDVHIGALERFRAKL